uniref:PPUP9013 n=1 Tax=Poeciliopsis prolifica TaxID=188132 RepID=A0A0S7EUH8_9TELE
MSSLQLQVAKLPQVPTMFACPLSFASLLCVTAAWPALSGRENRFSSEGKSEEVRSAAIKRLLEVFGMEDPPAVHAHKQPPQYMLDLYNTVADVDGVTKDPYLLEGNTVRSFFDKCEMFLKHVCRG